MNAHRFRGLVVMLGAVALARAAGDVLDPWELAAVLGLHVIEFAAAPWDFATDGLRIAVRAHPDRAVVGAWVFRALARCMLMATGEPWTLAEAESLAEGLSQPTSQIH